jgi:hypothetical protein
MDTSDVVTYSLSLPEVLQVILSWLDDLSTNNFRCSREWASRVDVLRGNNYWKDRLMVIWPSGILPEAGVDYRCFYVEVQYGESKYLGTGQYSQSKHVAAGQFLPSALIMKYLECYVISFNSVEVFKDAEGYHMFEDVIKGVILTDDVKKFEGILPALQDHEKLLSEEHQEIWRVLYMWFEGFKLDEDILRSSGGWNILMSRLSSIIAKATTSTGDFCRAALESPDICHYLVFKAIVPLNVWEMADGDFYGFSILRSPQNLDFYLTEFPDEIETTLEEFIDGY